LFQVTTAQYYVVPEWEKFRWLSHGFGTREAKYPPEGLATVKQVHGSEVKIVHEAGFQGEGDGLISDTIGILAGIRTADCLPILLIDPVHRVVSAVHAGWRGTVAGIAVRAVRSMQANFGSETGEIEAAIGPGIGKCCFEVGPEVAREFGPWESDRKTCLDLSQINRVQLEAAGVSRIYEAALCTVCGTGFYSFRRERDQAGRMVSYAGRRA
jgi:YfiH family protein